MVSIVVVTISPDELEPFRTVMRDLQIGAANYYACTSLGEELGSTVRSFVANCQNLNDWFINESADAASYAANFGNSRHPEADVIDAMKYVRNVSQHVLHVVKPSDSVTLIGGDLGFRIYAEWETIPEKTHAKLRPGTQRLRPLYESRLQGKEVMSTMLAVLRFFFDVAPSIVHRNAKGEWTGFPLMSQPGVSSPLHPEEPVENIQQASAWLNNRLPGGTVRVICGQATIRKIKYVCGYTFVGRLSFAPFYEQIDQVIKDIANGFSYRQGNLPANVSDVSVHHPDAPQSQVLESQSEIETWTTPVTQITPDIDWITPGIDRERLRQGGELEIPDPWPDYMAYQIRRARRLNALIPPRKAIAS